MHLPLAAGSDPDLSEDAWLLLAVVNVCLSLGMTQAYSDK